jgi:hypothetical protein
MRFGGRQRYRSLSVILRCPANGRASKDERPPICRGIRAVALRGSLRSRLRVTAKATDPGSPLCVIFSENRCPLRSTLTHTLASPAGSTRGSIPLRKSVLQKRWIAGSSPAMT